MLKSFDRDQVSMYSRSSRTQPSKPMALRVETARAFNPRTTASTRTASREWVRTVMSPSSKSISRCPPGWVGRCASKLVRQPTSVIPSAATAKPAVILERNCRLFNIPYPDRIALRGASRGWRSGLFQNLRIEVIAWVPERYSLSVHSGRGDVQVAGHSSLNQLQTKQLRTD